MYVKGTLRKKKGKINKFEETTLEVELLDSNLFTPIVLRSFPLLSLNFVDISVENCLS